MMSFGPDQWIRSRPQDWPCVHPFDLGVSSPEPGMVRSAGGAGPWRCPRQTMLAGGSEPQSHPRTLRTVHHCPEEKPSGVPAGRNSELPKNVVHV